MKTLSYFVLVFFFFCSIQGYSQSYVPSEQTIAMGKNTVSAWVIRLNDEPLDDLKEGWRDYVKQQLDVKMKKEGRNGLVAKEITAPSLYGHPGDLKASFYTEQKRSILAVAFMPGYDLSLNTRDNPTEAANLRRFATRFVKHYKTDQLNALVAAQEKRERSLESAYEHAERERQQLRKHVAKVEKKMNSAKTDASKKFELNNEKIASESRTSALEEIMDNHKRELVQINQKIQKYRADISHLETLFAEPLADQESGIQ